MARARDLITPDMFEAEISGALFDIPRPAPATPGSMDFSREIAHVMSRALKECPLERADVAARMTKLLGKEVSLSMLNAWTAESATAHNISLVKAIAFDAATDGYALLQFFAEKRGCKVLVGEDALKAELGEIEQMKARLAQQEKAIKRYLEKKR